ncbi:MAG: HAD family hydrolase [Nanoarchaeota archaeon]|nr:HAD family hydrolase [Nanoarchaeota archaeon]
MLKNISAIGFDLDGTLYPITPEIRKIQRGKIYENISKYFGIPLEHANRLFEENYSAIGSGTKTIGVIAKSLGKPSPGRDFVQEALEQADFLDLIEKNPSLVAMLERMSRSKKHGRPDLITGSTREYALRKLERVGISPEVFLYLFTHEDGSKSSQDIYEKWLSRTMLRPSQHLYIGDQQKLDIDVPRSLGIRTCIVGEYELADFQIENILDLEALLN